MSARKKTLGRQNGVTLLEVLIAIVVLSIGMLGMLGIMMNSMKLTTSSNYRSTAAQQAYSLADTLKANIANWDTYTTSSATSVLSCLTAAGCLSTPTNFSNPSLIGTEINMWNERLATILPSGAGTVCRDASPTGGIPGGWQWWCRRSLCHQSLLG
jgi:type IV pilus assembly protein PilV